MVGSDSLLREHLVNWNVFYIFFLETFNIQQRKYVWLRMWCHRTAVTPMLNQSLDPLMFFHRSKKIRLFFGDPGTEYSILSNKKRHFITLPKSTKSFELNIFRTGRGAEVELFCGTFFGPTFPPPFPTSNHFFYWIKKIHLPPAPEPKIESDTYIRIKTLANNIHTYSVQACERLNDVR